MPNSLYTSSRVGGSHVDRPNSSMKATEALVIRELMAVVTKQEKQLDQALEKVDEYANKMVDAYKLALSRGEKVLKLSEELKDALHINVALVKMIELVYKQTDLERKDADRLRRELALAMDGRFI